MKDLQFHWMVNYHNLRDIVIRIVTSLFGLEKRMLESKKAQILNYKQHNIQLKKCKYLLIGDSHTYGLNKYLPPNPEIVNVGINGDTTYGLLKRLLDNIISLQSETLIIQIGYNDFKYRSFKQTVRNYKTVLLHLEKRGNVYVSSLLPVHPKRSIVNKKIKRFNQELQSLCTDSENCKFVDAFTLLYDNHTNGLIAEYSYDGVHLNDLGYKVYLKSISQIIDSLNSD